MQCEECLHIKTYKPSTHIRSVPATGRAAKNGLCCKHDRILHGPLTADELGKKQHEILIRKLGYRYEVVIAV